MARAGRRAAAIAALDCLLLPIAAGLDIYLNKLQPADFSVGMIAGLVVLFLGSVWSTLAPASE